jgi:hypothetical protein
MTRRKTDDEVVGQGEALTPPADELEAVVQSAALTPPADGLEAVVQSAALTPPADELEAVVREWLYFLAGHMPTLAIEQVVRELRAAGIDSQAALAAAPIPVVAAAIRAAWQTDAHSLTGIAARWRGQQEREKE